MSNPPKIDLWKFRVQVLGSFSDLSTSRFNRPRCEGLAVQQQWRELDSFPAGQDNGIRRFAQKMNGTT